MSFKFTSDRFSTEFLQKSNLFAGCCWCRSPSDNALCDSCIQLAKAHYALCPRCKARAHLDTACLSCNDLPDALTEIHCIGLDQLLLASIVRAAKRDRHPAYTAALIDMMLNDPWEPFPEEYLLPVPRHPLKQIFRSDNLPFLMKKTLSKKHRLNAPGNQPINLKRTRLRERKHLSRSDRFNQSGPDFSIEVNGQPPSAVCILDDIMTTGSTLSAIARMLSAHGVQQIRAYVLVRGWQDTV